MPSMPRTSKLFKRLAYSILGEPPAIAAKKSKKQKKLEKSMRTDRIKDSFWY